MTLRILHVTHTLEFGVGLSAVRFAADQTARGWDVTLACPDDPLEARWRVRDDEMHRVRWNARRAPGPATPLEVVALRNVIRATRPDLVHLHSSKAGLAGRLALRGRVPTVFQPHAWSFEAVGGAMRIAAIAWERRAARWADTIVCVSEAERRRGVEAGVRAGYRVIPNGVDLQVFTPADDDERRACRERLGLDPERPLAVCIGRLWRQKGQDVLIEAWPRVERAVPGAGLVFVGDGPDRKALEARAPSGVTFAGLRDDVPDWLAAADVVVQPSRWEGMPLVVLEAMARARSVVATDVDGVREAVTTGAGAVVTPGDTRKLASRVAERLRDGQLAATEGRAGRANVEANHDLTRSTDAVAQLYDDVLAARYDPSADA